MSDNTGIEWTDATWNPVVGCSLVSPGCTNCYAMKQAARIEAMFDGAHPKAGDGAPFSPSPYAGTTQQTKAGPVWTGKVALVDDHALTKPLRWKRPRRIFVNSMGDLFHDDVPDAWIDRVFAVMALAPQHIFQVLTKRSKRMREYCSGPQTRQRIDIARYEVSGATVDDWSLTGGNWPLPNVWLGVSAEDQARADERVPDLLATPAAMRFVSAEPLLGPIDMRRWVNTCGCSCGWGGPHGADLCGRGHVFDGGSSDTDSVECPECGASTNDSTCPECHNANGDYGFNNARLDWIIAGGESGPSARPMHPDWARAIRDQCAAAGTPFFFKQWGEFLPVGQCLPGAGKVRGATRIKPGRVRLHCAGTPERGPTYAFAESGVEVGSTEDGRLTFRVGKKHAGRRLDGVEHNAMPGAAP